LLDVLGNSALASELLDRFCKPEVTGSIPVRSTELATVETAGLRMRWLARISLLVMINSGPKTLARLETAWNEEYFRSIVAV